MSDEQSPSSVGRHTLESTVHIGRGTRAVVDDGEIHHISGEVTIEIWGAQKDHMETSVLLVEMEQAVEQAVEDFADRTRSDR